MKRLASMTLAVAIFALGPAPASATEQTALTARDGEAQAKLGISVGIAGDTAVAGAPDQGGTGAAYVFTKKDGKWTESAAPLVSPEPVEKGKFGFGVAISGDTIVVGEPKAEQELPGPGAAYVFVRSGDRWVQQAKLTPSDTRDNDAFGFKVAIAGDTVVVGAKGSGMTPSTTPGAAYVFKRNGSTWTEQARLAPPDGEPGDSFGYSVAVARDTVVVGAPGGGLGVAADEGAAYVFVRRGPTWSHQAKLVAADGFSTDGFGGQVAVFGNTAVIGSDFDTVGLNPAQGSAFVFERRDGAWTQQAKLTAPDGAAGDMFGRSVSVAGDTAVVGAQWDEPDGSQPLQNSGAIYVFKRAGAAWGVPTKVTVEGSGSLGVANAMSGRTVIASAAFTAVGANAAQGAAHVFDVRDLPPTTDEAPRSPLVRLG